MKKITVIIAFLLLSSTKAISESPYTQACEECKKRASQCIDDEGYNNCLQMIAKCNNICRKIYDINATEQTVTVEQYEKLPMEKETDKKSNDNIQIFGTKDITISVIKVKECCIEKMPGLQIWYTIKNLKRGFGLCYNMTHYTSMIMKRDKIKEYDLGEKLHFISYNKDIEITSYLVKVKKTYQLKMTLKAPEQDKLITKFFDIPFEILPYEKRTPKVQQILKSMLKKEEIDKFRIEDLAGIRWNVTAKIVKTPINQIPRLMFDIVTDQETNNAFIPLEDINSGKKEIISEINIPNDKWGPGEQKVIISVSDKKAKLSLWTKTAGMPYEREYNINELTSPR